jgi:hypothetical protein
MGRALVYARAVLSSARECAVPMGRDLLVESARGFLKRTI